MRNWLMDIRKLRYFITVAEELHFHRAAEKLNMTQPPLSQQIQNLEDELGVKLLERTRKMVRLTPAGAVFLEQARLIMAQLESIYSAYTKGRSGHHRAYNHSLCGFSFGEHYGGCS